MTTKHFELDALCTPRKILTDEIPNVEVERIHSTDPDLCGWVFINIDETGSNFYAYYVWETDCGYQFKLDDNNWSGGFNDIKISKYVYCPWCGKKIVKLNLGKLDEGDTE